VLLDGSRHPCFLTPGERQRAGSDLGCDGDPILGFAPPCQRMFPQGYAKILVGYDGTQSGASIHSEHGLNKA